MRRVVIVVLFISSFATMIDCTNIHLRKEQTWNSWIYYNQKWPHRDPKNLYPENNNRIDQQKHAQFNQQIHQPRKHNHGMRYNNRRNQ